MNLKAPLIVIEGLDGSGKATQTALLTQYIKEKNISVRQISFPDYNNPSSSLVKMYLGGELGDNPNDINPYAAASFYAVDRYASYQQFWKKDMQSGTVIVADRYATSNAIYQLAKLEKQDYDKFLLWIEDYEYRLLQLPKPDLVIYLDMPVEVSQKLLEKRYDGDESKKDLHESHDEFLKQCRQSALYSAKKYHWQIIDCVENDMPRTIEAIHQDIVNYVENLLFRTIH